MLAMVVNDDAGSLVPRGALRSIASRLAPTDAGLIPVGASMLAMVLNDDAGSSGTPRRSQVHREQARSYGCWPDPLGAKHARDGLKR